MTERERIARDYGVAPHLVPEIRVIQRGVSGENLADGSRDFRHRCWQTMVYRRRMWCLLKREGKA